MTRKRFPLILVGLAAVAICALSFTQRDKHWTIAPAQQQPAENDVWLTPASSAAAPIQDRILPILASADGQTFSAKIEQPLRDPRSRWHNPAKVVEVSFPRNFSAAVRVRCGVADVAARPVGASASSSADPSPIT